MDIAGALAADLAALAEASGDGGAGLRDSIDVLCRDARAAVRSYLGLSVHLEHPDAPLTLTVLEPAADVEQVRASLHVRLAGTATQGGAGAGSLTIYSGRPGAFDLLSGEMSALGAVVTTATDRDAQTHLLDVDRHGLRNASVINQAIGILIDRGHTEVNAAEWLADTARATDTDLLGAAGAVLGSVHPHGPEGQPQQPLDTDS